MNKKGKILMALAIGAVVILVGSSVVRYTLVHQDETVGQIVPVESEDNQAQPNTLDTSSQNLPADEKDALAILKSSVWTADGGKSTIAFKDGRYAESDGVANNMTAFDVSSVTKESNQTSIMLKLDLPDGTTKDSLVLVRQDAAGAYTVSSDDFTLAKTYSQGAPNAGVVEVIGVNDEFRELLGGTTEGLSKAATEYAHAHVPTATKATWTQSLVVDYASGTVSANFTCDDTASTVLTIEYARGPATFKVMG